MRLHNIRNKHMNLYGLLMKWNWQWKFEAVGEQQSCVTFLIKNLLMECLELKAGFCQQHTPLKSNDWMLFNPLSTKLYLSDLKTHFVPRSKHSLLRL